MFLPEELREELPEEDVEGEGEEVVEEQEREERKENISPVQQSVVVFSPLIASFH